MLFTDLELMDEIQLAIAQCGYKEATPIQEKTITPVLEGRDVLGCAQTGTGKTAAFALPILQRLAKERKQHIGKRTIRALILTPTRELAVQIAESFQLYGKKLPIRTTTVFGGVSQVPQVSKLRKGVDVVVATPGRLNDLIRQGHIQLSHLEIFVLDEADRMLDMGFSQDVNKIIELLPKNRQTLLFSATMPDEVEKLALSILDNPETVKVNPVSSTVDTIEQYLYRIDKGNKRHLLASLLEQEKVESALVFTRTKHGADRVVKELEKASIRSKAIHGDKSQASRQQALKDFKNGTISVMVATDIAARGIDIAGLSHVINYDLPNEAESYVHRIGRTGRAGREGIAISFCSIDEEKDLNAIQRLIKRNIPVLESEWPMQIFTPTPKAPRGGKSSNRQQQQSSARTNNAEVRKNGKSEKVDFKKVVKKGSLMVAEPKTKPKFNSDKDSSSQGVRKGFKNREVQNRESQKRDVQNRRTSTSDFSTRTGVTKKNNDTSFSKQSGKRNTSTSNMVVDAHTPKPYQNAKKRKFSTGRDRF